MKISALKTLHEMNNAETAIMRAMNNGEDNPPELLAESRELLRKLREKRRIFIYKQKSFTSNGHTVRH